MKLTGDRNRRFCNHILEVNGKYGSLLEVLRTGEANEWIQNTIVEETESQ